MAKKPIETKFSKREVLLLQLAEVSLKIGRANDEIKKQQTIIQGLGVQGNGIATEIEKLDVK